MTYFTECSHDIDLVQFITQYSYIIEKSTINTPTVVLRNYDSSGVRIDTLLVRRGATGEYFYTNRHNSSDKGNIIQFLYNHVTTSYHEINNILHLYSNFCTNAPQLASVIL